MMISALHREEQKCNISFQQLAAVVFNG